MLPNLRSAVTAEKFVALRATTKKRRYRAATLYH